MNEAFAKWIRTGEPFVTLKTALTLDGQAALPRVRPRAPPAVDHVGGIAPRSPSHAPRLGRDSHRQSAPCSPTIPCSPIAPALPRRRKLLRVVLDAKLRLPLRSRIARTAEGDVLVFTAAPAGFPARSPTAQSRNQKSCAFRRAAAELDLRAVMRELGRRDILSVILESGPTLNRAALEAGIVDKMRLFVAPQIAGARANLPAFAGWGMAKPHALQNVTYQTFGPDVSIEGYLRDVYRNR